MSEKENNRSIVQQFKRSTLLGIVVCFLTLNLELLNIEPHFVYGQGLTRREMIEEGDTNLRKNNLTATTNPIATDDSSEDYEVKSVWINISTGQVWMAVDVSVGTAIWKDLTSGGVASAYNSFSDGSATVSANGPESLLLTSNNASCTITVISGDPDQIDFACGGGTGTIDGTGTAGTIPKWSDSNTLTNSIIKETANGAEVGDAATNSFESKCTGCTGNLVHEAPRTSGTVSLVSKEFPMAGCDNTTAGSIWDLPTTSAATAACLTGTNTQQGLLTFANGQSAQMHFYLPPLPTAAVANLVLLWSAGETSATGTWALQAVCTPLDDTAADDPAFGTFWAPSQDTSSGTANQVKATTGTDVGFPASCAGGNKWMHLKLSWTAGTATDFDAKTLYVRF